MRLLGRGDMPVLIMALLCQTAQHGYELIKAMETLSEGSYCPSPGSVYPVLARLQREGMVCAVASADARKAYAATEQGRAWLEERPEQCRRVLGRLGMAARRQARARLPAEVEEAMDALKAALFSLRESWSDSRARQVAETLRRASEAVALVADKQETRS